MYAAGKNSSHMQIQSQDFHKPLVSLHTYISASMSGKAKASEDR